ncbi:MAG TPA: DUF6422 family protein [Mycobacterium sp.]
MADYDENYDEREETLHRAALLVIRARKEAVKMLRSAGVEVPDTGGRPSWSATIRR